MLPNYPPKNFAKFGRYFWALGPSEILEMMILGRPWPSLPIRYWYSDYAKSSSFFKASVRALKDRRPVKNQSTRGTYTPSCSTTSCHIVLLTWETCWSRGNNGLFHASPSPKPVRWSTWEWLPPSLHWNGQRLCLYFHIWRIFLKLKTFCHVTHQLTKNLTVISTAFDLSRHLGFLRRFCDVGHWWTKRSWRHSKHLEIFRPDILLLPHLWKVDNW